MSIKGVSCLFLGATTLLLSSPRLLDLPSPLQGLGNLSVEADRDWLFVCSCRYSPYDVSMKYKTTACAALLNPNSAEPIVWPSPWKFISELDPQAKLLLEAALAEANYERETASNLDRDVTRTTDAKFEVETAVNRGNAPADLDMDDVQLEVSKDRTSAQFEFVVDLRHNLLGNLNDCYRGDRHFLTCLLKTDEHKYKCRT